MYLLPYHFSAARDDYADCRLSTIPLLNHIDCNFIVPIANHRLSHTPISIYIHINSRFLQLHWLVDLHILFWTIICTKMYKLTIMNNWYPFKYYDTKYSHTFTPITNSEPQPRRMIIYHRICHQYRGRWQHITSRYGWDFVSFDSIDGSELSFDQLAHDTTPNGVT